jgi:membrane-associated phospholipid phosphatase
MASADSPQSPLGLLREAWARARTHWVFKLLGIPSFFTAFFITYFWILNHPQFAVTTVPRIFVDRMVPFQPGALPLYLSLWFYVVIAPALLRTGREMVSYTIATTLLGALGFLVFLAWPTAVPPALVDPQQLPELARLKTVDASGNAFPSLHVAFAVFSAIWLGRLLAEMCAGPVLRAFNWVWCAAIVYSTLAIRQHVALDAVSGAVLGAAVATVQQRLLDHRAPPP